MTTDAKPYTLEDLKRIRCDPGTTALVASNNLIATVVELTRTTRDLAIARANLIHKNAEMDRYLSEDSSGQRDETAEVLLAVTLTLKDEQDKSKFLRSVLVEARHELRRLDSSSVELMSHLDGVLLGVK